MLRQQEQMQRPERAMRRCRVAAGREVAACLRAADIIPLGLNWSPDH